MKKVFLLAITTGLALNSFAQNLGSKAVLDTRTRSMKTLTAPGKHDVASKTTAVIHDTLVMLNINSTDTQSIYRVSISGAATDSGYVGGMNFLGVDGWAERYDFKPTDSTIQVLGVWMVYTGAVNPSSTRNLTIKTWSQSARIDVTSSLHYNGIPGTVLDSIVVPFTGLNSSNTAWMDSVYFFGTPTAYLSDSFFVGATTGAYTWPTVNGDTLAIATTRMDHRHTPEWFITGTDTVVNNQNMANITAFGGWFDMAFDLGFNLHYFMFPVVNSKLAPTSTQGITRRNFTLFGNYPNPATNNTNIRFSVANATDVTVTVADMTGRSIKTVNFNGMTAGEHTVELSTAELAAGNYVYLIRTAEGDGIANQFSIVK